VNGWILDECHCNCRSRERRPGWLLFVGRTRLLNGRLELRERNRQYITALTV